jgi:hypothetical protein
MAYQPHDDVNELEHLIQQSIKCCEYNNDMLLDINKQLYSHSYILKELLKCCRYKPLPPTKPNWPTKPYWVGQAYKEIEVLSNEPFVYPETPSQPIYTVVPKRIETPSNPLIIYPVDKGYFGVLSIPGSWCVVGKRIVDKTGIDLEVYLPLFFNHRVYEERSYNNQASNSVSYSKDYELVGMRGYVVKRLAGGKEEPLIIYETYNHRTGVRRTFEGNVNLWNKYANK